MRLPLDWLERLAELVVYELLNLEEGARLADALLYFIPGFTLLLALLAFVVYLLVCVTNYLSFEKIRTFLERHKRSGAGNVIASAFGAITPFCSCSSVPVFIGMMQAKIPLGIALSFLITSPLVTKSPLQFSG